MTRPAFVEHERSSVVRRSRVGEVVFGVQDGITSTIGVVSSMVGGHQSSAVTMFVGMAAACAGMFSMAVGSYLASTSELDVARIELERERQRIRNRPDDETDELAQIYESHGMTAKMARAAARRVGRDPERMLDVMAVEEFGVDAHPHDNPVKDAAAMGLSFLMGAGIPIVPYALLPQTAAFAVSVAVASLVLFGVGILKARVAGTRRWRSGLQTFALGATAAALGYVVGIVVPRLFGLQSAPG